MYTPETVLKNTPRFAWDLKIQTDQLIPAKRPDLDIINKKRNSGICRHSKSQSEKQRKQKEGYVLRLWWKSLRVTVIPIVIGALWTVPNGLEKSGKNLRLVEKFRPSKVQRHWNQPEY